MTFSTRHIFLIVSIMVVILSFLLFGRQTDIYGLLLLGGLLGSSISFLFAIIKKDTLKSKIIWTIIVITSVGMQQMTQSFLVKSSYQIFINKHSDLLTEANNIFSTKDRNLFIITHNDKANSVLFTNIELKIINRLSDEAGISVVFKNTDNIFYKTWGIQDISHGIYYYLTANKQIKSKHLKDAWYY